MSAFYSKSEYIFVSGVSKLCRVKQAFYCLLSFGRREDDLLIFCLLSLESFLLGRQYFEEHEPTLRDKNGEIRTIFPSSM